jgi:hypothetical protein
MDSMSHNQVSVEEIAPDLPLWAWASQASVVAPEPPPAEAAPSARAEAPAEPAASTPLLTLAQAIEGIASWTDLPVQRQRDLASSLRRVAHLLGRPAESIALSPAELARIEPALFQMSRARMAVVISNFRFVLRRLGLTAKRRASTQVILPLGWSKLVAEAASHSGRLGALTRFAAFCHARAIGPNEVSDDLLAAFDTEDRNGNLSTARNPAASVVARSWTALARRRPELGLAELRAPRRRQGYTLRLTEFPESFQRDREVFLARLSGSEGGRFVVGSNGPPRALRPATVQTRAFLIRQAASILVLRGIPKEELRGLADLVTPVIRAGTILDHLLELQERAAQARGHEDFEPGGGQLASMAETLRQVGKYYAKLGDADVEQLAKWARKAAPQRAEGLTS